MYVAQVYTISLNNRKGVKDLTPPDTN